MVMSMIIPIHRGMLFELAIKRWFPHYISCPVTDSFKQLVKKKMNIEYRVRPLHLSLLFPIRCCIIYMFYYLEGGTCSRPAQPYTVGYREMLDLLLNLST